MKTLFLGDVCPTMVTSPLFKEKNMEALFADVPSIFVGRDFSFVNLECALTESEQAIHKIGPALKGPVETAELLKQLGVDCCGLSNNHFLDYGQKGMQDSLDALEKSKLIYTGVGEHYEASRQNLIFEKDGERICVIAVCEHEYTYALENRMGCRPYDEYDTMEDIRKAKETYDRVIVIYHGGKEFCRYPSPRLRKLCHAMAKNGADMVLCQHSHCIGCYEQYNDCHILYGQGNFHFVKEHWFEGWFTSLAVAYDTKKRDIEFIPIITDKVGIRLTHNEEKEQILSEFYERNKKLLNGEWKQGWHDFCESVQELYMDTVRNAGTETATEHDNQMFAHFLDCEAHVDVWRELWPSYHKNNQI